MPVAILFWGLWIGILIAGLWNGWLSTNKPLGFAFALLVWVCVGLLGWHDFGAIVK